MDNLATVQTISRLDPIQGNPLFETATVLGKKVVVEKGTFKSGNLCVYIKPGTIIQNAAGDDFMVRNRRIAGVLSRGLCFPLTVLPVRGRYYTEGEDVTDLMHISGYRPLQFPAIFTKGGKP